jgi:uncharacterized damage-inducible protein DinB
VVIALGAALPAGAQGVSGYRGEFLSQLDATEKKFVDLANAIPQEKYGWRPGAGVRSVSEVFMHVAGANFMLTRVIGTPPPSGIDRGMEKSVTEKAQVVEMMKKSFAHMRDAVNKMDADGDKPVKIFGRESTNRGALLFLSDHMHEHLGQQIAYARTNGVVPPWSAGRE